MRRTQSRTKISVSHASLFLVNIESQKFEFESSRWLQKNNYNERCCTCHTDLPKKSSLNLVTFQKFNPFINSFDEWSRSSDAFPVVYESCGSVSRAKFHPLITFCFHPFVVSSPFGSSKAFSLWKAFIWFVAWAFSKIDLRLSLLFSRILERGYRDNGAVRYF